MSKRRILIFLVKLIIAAGMMIALVRTLHGEKIIRALRTADPLFFLLALLFLIPNLLIQGLKWRYLLIMIKPGVTFGEAMGSLLAGYSMGLITPGRVGEYGRAFFIQGADWMKVLGLTLLEKMYSFSIVILAGVPGLVYFLTRLFGFSMPRLILSFAVVAAFLYIISHPDFLPKFLNILPFRDKISAFTGGMGNFRRKQAGVLFSLSAAFYLVYCVQFYLLCWAFERISLKDALVAISASFLAKTLLPISLGDIGVREGASVFFFSQLGVQKTTAFNASFILFLIDVLIPSLSGLFIILKKR